MSDLSFRRAYTVAEDQVLCTGMVLGRIRALHPSCPFTMDVNPTYLDEDGDEVILDESDDPDDFEVSKDSVRLILGFQTEDDAAFFMAKYENNVQMLTGLRKEPKPLHLYFVEAQWANSDGIEKYDLWVRAESEDQAFALGSDYYEIPDIHGQETFTRADAEAFYDVGFEIQRKKTYREPIEIKAGTFEWDDADRLTVGAL
ncbi:hypothetical protein J2X36_004542 [Methylobacterium sp. BE186]|uniref:hypothetical protein n=1 Tax=Methylobacterium sp. BE186 TaxID=2817715 RepID=UPI00285ACD5C|nr:hypothetical protein [Methylobacterium sp. BE186]MDR7039764.1 hypothetical protein [Methylobacterium sp. BE186]